MHFLPFDASISLDMPFHCPIQPNQFHAALIFRLATVVSIDDNFLLLDRPIHTEKEEERGRKKVLVFGERQSSRGLFHVFLDVLSSTQKKDTELGKGGNVLDKYLQLSKKWVSGH